MTTAMTSEDTMSYTDEQIAMVLSRIEQVKKDLKFEIEELKRQTRLSANEIHDLERKLRQS